MRLSDLLQGCSNKTDTVMIQQYCVVNFYSIVFSTLEQSCYKSVSELYNLVTSCRVVPNYRHVLRKQLVS